MCVCVYGTYIEGQHGGRLGPGRGLGVAGGELAVALQQQLDQREAVVEDAVGRMDGLTDDQSATNCNLARAYIHTHPHTTCMHAVRNGPTDLIASAFVST